MASGSSGSSQPGGKGEEFWEGLITNPPKDGEDNQIETRRRIDVTDVEVKRCDRPPLARD
uniref:Uncharacterized protein n=1 Tax=Oryza meridionalis TaxID=40149 RepID=A0A0E0CD73_9ORYZ